MVAMCAYIKAAGVSISGDFWRDLYKLQSIVVEAILSLTTISFCNLQILTT